LVVGGGNAASVLIGGGCPLDATRASARS
jgi:hypothetical protein